MRIAYTVPGATSTAHTPIPAVTGAALNYKGSVAGQPGTQGISAPYPGLAAVINGDRYDSGYSGGSENMPPVFYPNLYYQRSLEIPGADVITGGMSVFSDNQLPIPAADPRGTAARLARPPVFLGQAQIKDRRKIPRWANWLPTPDFGS